MRRTGISLVTSLALLWAAAAAGAATSTPGAYFSPGYKGTKSFAAVAPVALASVTLGTGKYPNLLVDAAGSAHVVYDTDGASMTQDKINACTLQRGQTACGQSTGGIFPQEPEGASEAGNFPAGNADDSGPIPLVSGNQLYVVDRRYPDIFTTPAGQGSDTNVFLWSSTDGGATLTGPGEIGTNDLSGGAIVYGSAAQPAIGMISDTETGGTFFQGVPFGTFTSAQALLGTGDQAYSGRLALDGTTPIAAFTDLSGNIYIREWNTTGPINDAGSWSETSFHGYAPRIIGGPSGVFVLYSDSLINNDMFLQRIVGGQASGAPVSLGTSKVQPAVSESPTGVISLAYVDDTGVETRTSTDGMTFSPPQFTATAAAGVTHLVTAATADGGGFDAFVQATSGAIGPVVLAAFGTQQATGQPGLGPLPGGGIGSAAGDQLATSTCTTATFGVVTVSLQAGCFAHDPSDPNLDVSLGEVDINGLRLIPDAGVRIGIDPKLHTIDTTGAVSVVLSGAGLNITIFHGEIHAKIPTAASGADLFDFPKPGTILEGFPISGDIDVKLVPGGVQIPVSLSLPSYFGGVTGSATLLVTESGGLNVSSLEFKIGDLNIGALELKDVDISYTQQGNVWKGTATVDVPAGGGVFGATVSVEFDDGAYKDGSIDITLPYPGIPLDLNDPPPQLFLTHGGLELGLNPLSLTGTIGIGLSPLMAPGTGGLRDYVFSLDGSLGFSFGNPVTITATATGYLYVLQLAQAKLVYTIPDQVSLTGTAGLDLGVLSFNGSLGAIVDPAHGNYGGFIKSSITIHTGQLGLTAITGGLIPSDITIPGQSIAFNDKGFAIYFPPGSAGPYVGSISYDWGDTLPTPHPFSDVTGDYTAGIPGAAADTGRSGPTAHAAQAYSFTVPPGSPSVSLIVDGSGGSPAVTLTDPSGTAITPATTFGGGATAVAIGDTQGNRTLVGIDHPAAGRWTLAQSAGTAVPITSMSFALGLKAPAITAKLSSRRGKRTIRYRASLPANTAITFAETGNGFSRMIGAARGGHGTLSFRPAALPAGRRTVVAQITNNGLPYRTVTVGSFVQPRPARPSRARRLAVKATAHTFNYRFSAPANASKTLITIATSDGRHLQQIVPSSVRSGSVPVIGFSDSLTVTVTGIGADGRRGPPRSATAPHKGAKRRR